MPQDNQRNNPGERSAGKQDSARQGQGGQQQRTPQQTGQQRNQQQRSQQEGQEPREPQRGRDMQDDDEEGIERTGED